MNQENRPTPSPLTKIQNEVRAQMTELDRLIADAGQRFESAKSDLSRLQAERKQLVKVLDAASGRSSKSKSKSSKPRGKRLSPAERHAQIVGLLGRSEDGLTRRQLQEQTGLSAIYLQNLLKTMRDEGTVQSQQIPGGGGRLIWRAAA